MSAPQMVVVVGQGYVGLPVAMRAVEVGPDVVGLEVDPARAGALAAGSSYVEDVTDQRLQAALASGRYVATVDIDDCKGLDVAVITEPTPLLAAGSGLRAGLDFHLEYSPERIDPGNPTWNLVNTPKVVSGIDSASLDAVQGFDDSIVERTVPVRSPKEAELTEAEVAAADAVVVLTDHDDVDYDIVASSADYILDTRRRFRERENVEHFQGLPRTSRETC